MLEAVKEDRPGEKATATTLPKPAGFQLLIALPEVADTYDSGLAKTKDEQRFDEIYSVVGFVLEVGPDAYKSQERFPSGPYCKKGDFVLMGALKGLRFKIHGKEFRMLNDDSVLGVVDDPRGYSRA